MFKGQTNPLLFPCHRRSRTTIVPVPLLFPYHRRSRVNGNPELRQRNLIDYSRGTITILDRPGLGAAACGCYGLVKDMYREVKA